MIKKIFAGLFRFKEGLFRRFKRFNVIKLLKKHGNNFICDNNVYVYGGENITLGDNVVLNKGVILQSCDGAKISIGNNVTLSYDVKLLTGNLNFIENDISEKRGHNIDSIKLNDNVWVGAGSIILPGVTIGRNIIIAAGSIVTKSITHENTIYGGNPAKLIRSL